MNRSRCGPWAVCTRNTSTLTTMMPWVTTGRVRAGTVSRSGIIGPDLVESGPDLLLLLHEFLLLRLDLGHHLRRRLGEEILVVELLGDRGELPGQFPELLLEAFDLLGEVDDPLQPDIDRGTARHGRGCGPGPL